jgi:hypothetical protein
MKTTAPVTIPELGPSLGRLVVPSASPGSPTALPLEDIRLKLVSQLFEQAGDARRWLREGDRALAFETINRQTWEAAWTQAVHAVATRVAERANARMLAAGQESRIASRRLAALALDTEEIQALASRLGRAGMPLEEALAHLEVTAQGARSERATTEVVAAWQDALSTAARRTEAAWLALEERVGEEWRRWEVEIAGLRSWRRPTWPLMLVGLATFGLFLWCGLMVGGYVPIPDLLRPAAEWIWARWN